MTLPPGLLLRDQTSVRLRVRLTPRAGRDSLGAIEELANGEAVLVAHVRAVPEKGEANTALAELVARTLGVAKSKVAVVSGQTSRVKTVRIDGDPDSLAAAVERLDRGGSGMPD